MEHNKPTRMDKEEADSALPTRTGSLGRMAIRRLLQKRSARIGLFLLGLIFLVAIFPKQIAPYDPTKMLAWDEEVKRRAPPCIHLLGCPESEPQHIMGTDSRTRDYFSRVLYGARISLSIGVATVGTAMMIGTILGAVAGYTGGWLNSIIMRMMDLLLAFPVLILALVVMALLGPGLINSSIAIMIVQIPHYARITRASVLSLKETEFVQASRALGGGYFHVLLNRILPNTLTPLIIKGTLGIGSAILDAAALSFLGFGTDPQTPEWGAMLGFERNSIFTAPHLVIFPGMALMITVLGFNLLGEGLRDSLDPRLAYSSGEK